MVESKTAFSDYNPVVVALPSTTVDTSAAATLHSPSVPYDNFIYQP
jgi:hypothetical protein